MSLTEVAVPIPALRNDTLPPHPTIPLSSNPALPKDPLESLRVVHSISSSLTSPSPSPKGTPQAIYDGGFDRSTGQGIRMRIANGAAGQTGLIKAWADAFIRYMVAMGHPPFQVAWYLSESTESLALLSAGEVDIALTYVPAAEAQVMHLGNATQRIYAFRDRFALVGPSSNPASLNEEDDVLMMINKIVTCGNADAANPPRDRPPTRFLSRSDRSATNIKESLLFLTIGQLPWSLTASEWYTRHRCFPREALQLAAALSMYTLIDYGTWLDAPASITSPSCSCSSFSSSSSSSSCSSSSSSSSALRAFKIGTDDPGDALFNPAHLLYGAQVPRENERVCAAFMRWVLEGGSEGGQWVLERFEKNGKVLYTGPP